MANLDPVVQIGDWHYQVIYGQLWPVDAADVNDMVRLEPRLHSLLNYFLLHPDTLLAKDTLIEKVWPPDEGTDAAVMRAVGALRKVLGDDVRSPCYIETVSKKGYRWLAAITPAKLQDIPLAVIEEKADTGLATSLAVGKTRPVWRFIAVTATAVIIGCASLAYVLATYTSTPLLKLPDTITPISALSGQEYWPVLAPDNTYVLYQHKAVDSRFLNWSMQSFADLRVEHLPQKYRQLSQALWLDNEHIVFRAETTEAACYFYRQRLKPDTGLPEPLWPCQKVLSQGAALWQQHMLWLDVDIQSKKLELWSGLPRQPVKLLMSLDHSWREVSQILLRGDELYLLAQETVNQSVLLRLPLPGGMPEVLARFPYVITQFSWWDERQLLLSAGHQELQIIDLKSNSSQGLGPLTRELTQASRYPGQVLATQFLDYTTDILRVADNTATGGGIQLLPWHVSNRSERLLALSESGQAAFVSERAGHSQIWLAQERNSRQITRLTEQQQVQQLLWHQQQLLVLINARLYQLELASGQLQLYHDNASPGRYASCHGVLYWTTLTEDGWMLMAEKNAKPERVMSGVTDVRCGPQQALVLQFADSASLALLTAVRDLVPLPVQIDWRSTSGEQWFADSTGIYWLGDNNTTVYRFDWLSQQTIALLITEQEMPVAIYSDGNGLGYIVRQRPYDTDIVWLQNRR